MAVIDRCELLLARLFVICQSFSPDIVSDRRIFRNRTNINGRSGRAIVLLDNAEDAVGEPKATRGGMIAKLFSMDLLPKIQLFDNGTSEEIGPKLSALRLEMLVRVLNDQELIQIAGTSYALVQYLGSEREIETGEKAEGRIDLKFAIRYPLIGSEISEP